MVDALEIPYMVPAEAIRLHTLTKYKPISLTDFHVFVMKEV